MPRRCSALTPLCMQATSSPTTSHGRISPKVLSAIRFLIPIHCPCFLATCFVRFSTARSERALVVMPTTNAVNTSGSG